MPKGHNNSEDNPSYVVTAKMNPVMSELERGAWEIWQSISRRDLLRSGYTTKAEWLASAILSYYEGNTVKTQNKVEMMLEQILSRLKGGGASFQQDGQEIEDVDVLIDFAQNQQLLDTFMDGGE